MRVNLKVWIVSGTLCLAGLPAQAGLWDKGPTFKEKVAALAAAGKTIPVVCVAAEFEAASTVPPSIREDVLFKAPAPADFAAPGEEVVKALNAGFGVQAFKAVSADKVPIKESRIWGKTPDWAATDFEVFVAVREYPRYTATLGSASGAKSIKLYMRGEVELMENVVDKKGVKEAKSIKTLRAAASSKSAPLDKTPVKLEECSAAIPAGSLQPELVKGLLKEIEDYAKKK